MGDSVLIFGGNSSGEAIRLSWHRPPADQRRKKDPICKTGMWGTLN